MIRFEKQVDEKIEKFYNEYFSKQAQDMEDPDNVLEYCLNKAWADATQRERFNGKQSKIIQNKEKFVAILKDEINAGKFSPDYDTWHNHMCNNDDEGMTYGIWQKFINMTFKYMCCSGKFPEIEFSQCHCPIDSIIAQRADALCIVCGLERSEKMKSIARSGKPNWNNMDTDEYGEVRKKIREITEKCTINNSDTVHPTELEFDFLLW